MPCPASPVSPPAAPAAETCGAGRRLGSGVLRGEVPCVLRRCPHPRRLTQRCAGWIAGATPGSELALDVGLSRPQRSRVTSRGSLSLLLIRTVWSERANMTSVDDAGDLDR